MTIQQLEVEHATAYYDKETQLIHIIYRGNLDATVSYKVYHWLDELFKEVGVDHIRGEVFDFRQVNAFMPDNLMEARKKSRGMNLKTNTNNLPVAMIVENFYHEEILRGPMQNVPENQRKQIVRTEEEAIQFIDEWHAAKDNNGDG